MFQSIPWRASLLSLLLLVFLLTALIAGCGGGGSGSAGTQSGTVDSVSRNSSEVDDSSNFLYWPDELKYRPEEDGSRYTSGSAEQIRQSENAEKTLTRAATQTGVFPGITEAKCFGGAYNDAGNAICQVPGGFIFVGNTRGAGDDYWIVRLDQNLNVVWQKTVGGTSDERAYAVSPTSDEGFVVAGYSKSYDGDLQDIDRSGNEDAWIVKFNSLGVIEWSKCVGGSGREYAYSIQQTTDGGYIVAGEDDGDFWVFKLDNTGTVGSPPDIEFRETYGLYYNPYENARSVQQTSDGGYIVAGCIYDTSIDRYKGNADFLVVKLNSSGEEEWARCYGGYHAERAFSIRQTSDTGYVVAGYTKSTDGDVQSFHHGYDDFWVVKINSDGTVVEWEKCMGGTEGEIAWSIIPTMDGGYMVAGDTTSSNGDVTGKHYPWYFYDYWVVKLGKPSGGGAPEIEWSRALGGYYDERAYSVIQTPMLDYIAIGGTQSNDGDITGDNHGSSDAWAVRFGEPIPFPTLKELTFENTTNLADNDGSRIPPIYYEVRNNGEIIHNPAALALSNLTPGTVATSSSLESRAIVPFTGKCNITLNLDKFPNILPSASYEVRLKSLDEDWVYLEKAYTTFTMAGKKTIRDAELKVPNKVQAIRKLKVDYRRVEDVGGKWVPKTSWLEDTVAKLDEPIYVTLAEPLDPIGIHGQDKARKGLVDIACHLAEGATTPEEARIMMVEKLRGWLNERGFHYDVNYYYFYIDTKVFDYGKFIAPLYNPDVPDTEKFKGDCTSVSGFYTLCCKTIGVDMNMSALVCPPLSDRYKSFMTYLVRACGVQEYWPPLDDYRPTQWANWNFHAHQIACFGGQAFDPTLLFPESYISPYAPELQSPVIWPNGFAAGVDKIFDYQIHLFYQFYPGTTSVEWYTDSTTPEEYTMSKVYWPDWKYWLP